ncbi:MAG: glycosyltransferase, partial [Planctomycetota bacterium]
MRLGVLPDRVDEALGGAEAHTRRLLARAAALDMAPVVACLEGTGGPGVETLLVPAPRRRPARDRCFAREGIGRLREAGADVVLAFRHAPGCDVYLPHGGLVADALLARDHTHRAWAPRRLARALSPKTRFFLEAERALLARSRGPRVIAVSQALAARIRACYPAAAPRLDVGPNGVAVRHFDPAGFRAAGARERSALGLARPRAYVGLLIARDPLLKGAEVAVKSLAEEGVRALDPPFHLLVAGARLPAWLRRRARRLGV